MRNRYLADSQLIEVKVGGIVASQPVGTVTRGTTGVNRLRRVDRWLCGPGFEVLRLAEHPLVVDLGFGAHGGTSLEMFQRLRGIRPDVSVVGLEIEPERVKKALDVARPGLEFARGGFEVPLPRGRLPHIVRAMNVLRQYPRDEVAAAWDLMCSRLAPGGFVLDGTCDELGRRAAWLIIRDGSPVSLTLSYKFGGFEVPSDVAERLPKFLIHENLSGYPIFSYLSELDAAWARSAPHASFGLRQRFIRTCEAMREQGWPVLDGVSRWRLGEITIEWPAGRPEVR